MDAQGFTGNGLPRSQRNYRERAGRQEHSAGGDEELTLSQPQGPQCFPLL